MTASAAHEAQNQGYWSFLNALSESEPVRQILLRRCEGEALIAGLHRSPIIDFGSFEVDFEADLWDFSGITALNIDPSSLRLPFAPGPLADELKLYAITGIIWRRAKVQSIAGNVRRIGRAIRHLGLSPQNMRLISVEQVDSFLYSLRASVGLNTLGLYAASLADFAEFHERLFGRMVDADVVPRLRDAAALCRKIAFEAEGYPCIPPDYEEPLLELAKRLVRDEADSEDAITGAVLTILSKTGFRTSECLGLEAGALEILEGAAGLPDIAYLTFKTYKGEPGDGAYRLRRTIVSAEALEAYLFLERACEKRRSDMGVRTLIVYPRQRRRFCSSNSLNRRIRSLLVKFSDDVPCANPAAFPELPTTTASKAARGADAARRAGLQPDDPIAYVTPHMFRVTFATKLYEQGYDLAIISKFMNHISSDITTGYVRSDRRIEERMSDAVYRALLVDEAELLGPRGKEFSTLVKEHAASLKGAVYEDEDELIAACSRRYPLRLKPGYVCTKCGNVRGCPSDSGTDEVFCAFGVCQNQHHMYFMLDVHLEAVRFHIRLVEENRARGHVMAAKNELRKARNVIEGTLLPEIESLDDQIERHGEAHVLGRHPHLTPIIRDRTAISEEVGSWLSMDLTD